MIAPPHFTPQRSPSTVTKSEIFGKRTGKSHDATVLVVDDEWLVRWSLSESLTGAGYRVRQAGNAREAVTAFQASPMADVVLLDLRLPDSADLDLLRQLKRLSPACAIILITAHRSVDLIEQAERAGAFHVLDKPFDVDVVVQLVGAALGPSGPAGAIR
jgi:DNA-binding NtrC family response regulator